MQVCSSILPNVPENISLPLDNHIGEVNFLKMKILLAGLLLWNQTRQQWLGNNKSEKRVQPRQPRISWNTIYESLHGNYKPFQHPIPLPVKTISSSYCSSSLVVLTVTGDGGFPS
ncbi:phospholipase D alpha 1-like isoform X1 [Gossypium australe]|uniref:Phospholipase D alpha 1-like isoform X1 n=1 Tax=Gossypium australe TaxID=47621 RepID=A0A5B6X7Q3_9ROSI|nr:phospholipase D alpha 1-like isoform X1 [Gossypium australe]